MYEGSGARGLIACQQREIQHLKGAAAQSESPPVVKLDPLGADSGGMTSHQAALDCDGPVATAPAICPPSPSFPGEALPSSPTQVVQPVSSVTTPATPPLSGHTLPVPATHVCLLLYVRVRPHPLIPSREKTPECTWTTGSHPSNGCLPETARWRRRNSSNWQAA